ncbi:MAG: thiol-disulfide oxidoreductase DCC family protein [Halomonas sp.]|uniref:thiol-disulfide oxidoreductase DCC family protein n=1 Tax=Halomonas sp. TaxID=1486246 RepID=UPI003F9149E6
MTDNSQVESSCGAQQSQVKNAQLKVYYDAACPLCRRERQRYESWQKAAEGVAWLDVNTHDEHLIARGVVPREALLSLHVEDAAGQFHDGIDAYVLLMRRVPRLKPLAWVIGLPVIKPVLTWIYEGMVRRRLARDGRL